MSTRPATNSTAPRACHDARTLSGRFTNQPRLTASVYNWFSTLDNRSENVRLRLESVGSFPSRNRPDSSVRSYVSRSASGLSVRCNVQSALPNHPSLGISSIVR